MKQFILSAFLIAISFYANSQNHVRLSFTGSPSVNWMRTNNPSADQGKSVLGYDFGLNGDFYFSEDERYSLSTGLLITNIGGQISYRGNPNYNFSGSILPDYTKIKYHLRYVEIPLDIKLKTNQFDRNRYWGQFGFSTMINIGAKGDSNEGTLNKSNINDEVNLFNLAMNVGVGYDFDLGGNNSFSAGIIFQNGLIDVTTDNDFTDNTIINSLKLRIGLIF
jgi:hypothetical protein